MNSSPPCRLTVSEARAQSTSRPAIDCSSLSPIGVPEGVIDVLEAVQIQEQNRRSACCGGGDSTIA